MKTFRVSSLHHGVDTALPQSFDPEALRERALLGLNNALKSLLFDELEYSDDRPSQPIRLVPNGRDVQRERYSYTGATDIEARVTEYAPMSINPKHPLSSTLVAARIELLLPADDQQPMPHETYITKVSGHEYNLFLDKNGKRRQVLDYMDIFKLSTILNSLHTLPESE